VDVRGLFAEENIWTYEEDLTGGRRKLHNEDLHYVFTSPHTIRMIRAGHAL
jgi:hypothetical protein